jgi:hypothetical protein
MGMDTQDSRLVFLRSLAAEQGVAPTDEDLTAVLGFLDRILPELERLAGTLGPEDAAGAAEDRQ